MLLNITRSASFSTPADSVWAVVRQPTRVAACLPNLQEFSAKTAPGEFLAVLVERLGPFAVNVTLQVSVAEDEAARRMTARVSGEDRAGNARVRGDIGASVTAVGTGANLDVTSRVEVLGRLATLGAVPIRRRGDQVFDQFVKNLSAAVSADSGMGA
jgi:uncharacterized protein